MNEMRVGSAVAFERAGICDEMRVRAVRVRSLAAGRWLIFRQIEKGLGREVADGLGQEVRVVGRFHALGHLGLWLLRRM